MEVKMMNLTQLEYFYKVAHSPTLTEAASELHVSQPAVSKNIRDLEEEFQTRFFTRSGRRMYLNAEGRVLLKHATDILSSVDALRAELQDTRQREDMTLRLGVFAASALVPDIISSFSKDHPNIKIQLIMHGGYGRSEDDRTLDMVLAAAHELPQQGKVKLLIKEHIKLAVPVGHPLLKRDSVTLQELTNEAFISLSKGKILRTIMDHYCGQAGLTPNVVLESDDPYMIRNLVSYGFGVAFVPEITWKYSTRGPQVYLDEAHPCMRYLYCQMPDDTYTSTASRLFLSYLQAYFQNLRL